MTTVLSIENLSKIYASGVVALHSVDLAIHKGEIFALLGPNGAGKTTLIGIICGLVRPSSGMIMVDGHHWQRDYRRVRAKIGLVPQELYTEAFEKVIDTVRFSRALFGCRRDDAYLEQLLRDLSLWDKRNSQILALSGGMKRRLMIAKALSHEPDILFLDEPTAGVDVELRRDMWVMVRRLRDRGVTIILTTHYIEEAEEMADRVGVINRGELMLVEDKAALMAKLGGKQLSVRLTEPLKSLPAELGQWAPDLSDDGLSIHYRFDSRRESGDIAAFLREIDRLGIAYRDLETKESSLEDIFVSLVSGEGHR